MPLSARRASLSALSVSRSLLNSCVISLNSLCTSTPTPLAVVMVAEDTSRRCKPMKALVWPLRPPTPPSPSFPSKTSRQKQRGRDWAKRKKRYRSCFCAGPVACRLVGYSSAFRRLVRTRIEQHSVLAFALALACGTARQC